MQSRTSARTWCQFCCAIATWPSTARGSVTLCHRISHMTSHKDTWRHVQCFTQLQGYTYSNIQSHAIMLLKAWSYIVTRPTDTTSHIITQPTISHTLANMVMYSQSQGHSHKMGSLPLHKQPHTTIIQPLIIICPLIYFSNMGPLSHKDMRCHLYCVSQLQGQSIIRSITWYCRLPTCNWFTQSQRI